MWTTSLLCLHAILEMHFNIIFTCVSPVSLGVYDQDILNIISPCMLQFRPSLWLLNSENLPNVAVKDSLPTCLTFDVVVRLPTYVKQILILSRKISDIKSQTRFKVLVSLFRWYEFCMGVKHGLSSCEESTGWRCWMGFRIVLVLREEEVTACSGKVVVPVLQGCFGAALDASCPTFLDSIMVSSWSVECLMNNEHSTL